MLKRKKKAKVVICIINQQKKTINQLTKNLIWKTAKKKLIATFIYIILSTQF